MNAPDISQYTLSGLITYRSIMLREARFYVEVEPDKDRAAWYQERAEAARLRIVELSPNEEQAARNIEISDKA